MRATGFSIPDDWVFLNQWFCQHHQHPMYEVLAILQRYFGVVENEYALADDYDSWSLVVFSNIDPTKREVTFLTRGRSYKLLLEQPVVGINEPYYP